MPQSKSTMLPSFAAGELSAKLDARVDLAKYHVGATLLRNVFVDYRGGAVRRSGLSYCGWAKHTTFKEVRLIPFIFSTLETYAMEFSDNSVRAWSRGAPITETAKAMSNATQDDPCNISATAHGFSAGDTVVIEGVLGMVELNGGSYQVGATSANSFDLLYEDGTNVDSTHWGLYTGAGFVSRVYTLASPYDGDDLVLVKYVQNANSLTLTHPSYPPYDLIRTSANSFEFVVQTVGPTITSPYNLVAAASSVPDPDSKDYTGNYIYGYQVTALSKDGKEESLPSGYAICVSNILDQTQNKVVSLRWTSVDGASAYNIYKYGPVPADQPQSTILGYIGQTQAAMFTDANIASDFTKVPPQFQDPFSSGQIATISVTSGGAGYTDPFIPLVFTGSGSGAEGWAVVDPASEQVVSAYVTRTGKGYTSAAATAGGGGATFSVEVGPQSGLYPSCVSYIQQRRVYGGQPVAPEDLDFSQTGNYHNFDTTPTSLASDAMSVSLSSREINVVKAMVPMSTGLVVFTSGSAVLVSGSQPSAPIQPDTVTASAQASAGSNDVPPLVVNYNILYIQNKGCTVRDLTFDYGLQSYYGNDRSMLANHLFDNFQITEWCYAQEPNKLVWAVRDDGALLSLAYVPEQDVYGWSRHDSQGHFTSCCSVSEDGRDVLYVVCRRYFGGNSDGRRYVERITPSVYESLEDAVFVDSSVSSTLTYPDATLFLNYISGQWHARCNDDVFSAGDVGKTLWAAKGKATVLSYTDSRNLIVDVIQPFDGYIPNTEDLYPQFAGSWTLDMPFTEFRGLWHLAQKQVVGTADGMVVGPFTVSDEGVITLPVPATKVHLGLKYQSQWQTLALDTEGLVGTEQGKRKNVNSVTVRVESTRGLKVGSSFKDLIEIKDLTPAYAIPQQLVTGDQRVNLPGNWTKAGMVYAQQDYPLPATVLGLIPEVLSGDTTR